uniref:Uncharacterized protein n=1 Tax=Avena sativa TaxID=4498 RepID=A0ACD5ZCK7_AVESA
MVYYPVGVAVRCHCPLLLPRRAPATPLLRRGTLQSRPPASSARRPPWGRCHAVDPEDADDEDFLTLDLDQFEGVPDEDDEEDSPWEGALVYRRDAAAQHVEYATTLERLGLADLSSAHSRARAAAMGILRPSTKAKAPETTTPVLVSVDVARRRGRLRLDGIVRTVITLGCYRCADPAPEGIFANFSLLLTEDPVEEPDVVDLGTVYEEDRTKFPSVTGSQDEDDQDIDWDDRLHFPAGEKEIDISKHIRDIIHLEITLDAFCSATCKGLCLTCGANLNMSTCSCGTEEPRDKDVKRQGSLKDLLKPMQNRR